MNLSNLNVVELNAQEVKEIEGGNRWKRIGDALEKFAIGIGLVDAADRFMEGWNSHKG